MRFQLRWMISLILLVLILNYWFSLLLAHFSSSPLEVSSEILLPISLIIFTLLSVSLVKVHPAVHIDLNPLGKPMVEGETVWQILKLEWQLCWPDLRWILPLSTLLFLFLWWGWGTDFSSDGSSYLKYYLQLNDAKPVYYSLQVYLTPLAGLFYGGLLDVGGLPLLKLAQFIQALTAAAAMYWSARPWGREMAWLVVVFWWLQLDNQTHLHLVGNDSVVTWTMTLWLLSFRLAVQYQRPTMWFGMGLLTAATALGRPAYLMLITSLVILLLGWRQWYRAAVNVMAAGLAIALLLVPYVIYNGLRYDVYSLSRGSNFVWFSAVYSHSSVKPLSLIDPANGPASQEFSQIIEAHLLTTPTYEGITLEQFLTTPSNRTWDDSLSVVDRVKGWDTHYALLREVALEAVRAHPMKFFQHFFRNTLNVLVAKSRLVGATDTAYTDEVVYLVNKRPYTTWQTSQPDNLLPDPQAVERVNHEVLEFSQPILQDKPHQEAIQWVSGFWTRFGVTPLLMLASVPFAFFWHRGETRYFLAVNFMLMLFIVVPSAMVAAENRYRMPLHPLLILSLASVLYQLLKRVNPND